MEARPSGPFRATWCSALLAFLMRAPGGSCDGLVSVSLPRAGRLETSLSEGKPGGSAVCVLGVVFKLSCAASRANSSLAPQLQDRALSLGGLCCHLLTVLLQESFFGGSVTYGC